MIKFFFWHRFRNFMDDFLKDAMTFPNGYYDKDSNYIIQNEEGKSFLDFKIKSNDDTFAEKFSEILTNLGIEVTVKDERYSFNSKEESDEQQGK